MCFYKKPFHLCPLTFIIHMAEQNLTDIASNMTLKTEFLLLLDILNFIARD